MEIANTIQPTPEDAHLRICVEQFDNDGNLVVRTYGPTPAEEKEAHDRGECKMMCSYCWEEAMRSKC